MEFKNITKETKSIQQVYGFAGLFFLIGYVLGEFFPAYWWFSHSTSFLSDGIKYGVFILSILFFSISFYPALFTKGLLAIEQQKEVNFTALRWAISLVMAFVFYKSPMIADFYGESYLLNAQVDTVVETVSPDAKKDLFSFGLNPWAGQKTIFALISYASLLSGQKLSAIFLQFNAIFGFLFVFSWMGFIQKQISSQVWKTILIISALSAPFLLNFYGHLEINALVLWALLFFMILLVNYLQDKTKAKLIGVCLFLIVCLKLHAISLLFLPFCLLLIASHLGFPIKLNWTSLLKFILTPLYVLGAILYFLILNDYKDERNLDYTVQEYDRLFLPLISPEAPLDKYNLFGINHLVDFFGEVLFLWAPVALFLVVVLSLVYRKKINWNEQNLLFPLAILFVFGSFFFMVNPLLSMQMDWDLFSFPSPILLVALVMLIKQVEQESIKYPLFVMSLGITLLNIPFFSVHFNKESLSHKLENLGIRIYHSYYEWSAQTIHYGLGLIPEDRNRQIERKNILLNELQPYALEGNDREYGRLWAKEGAYFLDVHKDVPRAYVYLETALRYYPQDQYSRLLLLESSILLNLPAEAYELAIDLKTENYPDQASANRTLVQTALLGEKFKEAQMHAANYLHDFPTDTTMALVYKRLVKNDRVDELKNFFYVPKTN